MINNNVDWSLKIASENLDIKLNEDTRKSTGGFTFEVIPKDTGDCRIVLYVKNDEGRQVCLLATTYHASTYPMPPVFIGNIRSGEIINDLQAPVQLHCEYGAATGIFEEYPILSWQAELKGETFTGTGPDLSRELIDSINKSPSNEVLKLNVQLSENKTGYKSSEGVFLIK